MSVDVEMEPDIQRAKNFANLKHGSQQYNNEVPYVRHLEQVIWVLDRFGFTDTAIVCAAWCHDIIEDTDASYADVKRRFGEEVAELVYAVTSELGRNRKERNAKTYPKLAAAPMRARALKLADRIANVEYGMANEGKFEMYSMEFPAFQEALRFEKVCLQVDYYESRVRDPELEPMWNYLNKLLT